MEGDSKDESEGVLVRVDEKPEKSHVEGGNPAETGGEERLKKKEVEVVSGSGGEETRDEDKPQAPEEAEEKPVVEKAGLREVYRAGREGEGMSGKPDVEEDVEARLDRLFETLWTTIKARSHPVLRGDVKPIPLREGNQIIHETIGEIADISGPRVTREFCRVFLRTAYGTWVAPYLLKHWDNDASDEFRRLAGLPLGPTKTAVELIIEKIMTVPPPKIKAAWDDTGISFGSTVDRRRGWVKYLGSLRDPAAVPFLIELLEDQHTRMWAVQSLSKIGDPRAIEPLMGLLEVYKGRRHIEPRGRVMRALMAFKDDPRVSPTLKKMGRFPWGVRGYW